MEIQGGRGDGWVIKRSHSLVGTKLFVPVVASYPRSLPHSGTQALVVCPPRDGGNFLTARYKLRFA
jgi:hypothetical protein